jgi:hypothetical protein
MVGRASSRTEPSAVGEAWLPFSVIRHLLRDDRQGLAARGRFR